MKRWMITLVCACLLLSGCGGTEETPIPPDSGAMSSAAPAEMTGKRPADEEIALKPEISPDGSKAASENQSKPLGRQETMDIQAPGSQQETATKQAGALAEQPPEQSGDNKPEDSAPQLPAISQITTLVSGFSSANFSGNDGFDAFLAQGGAASDGEVTKFLAEHLLADVTLSGGAGGCSTLAVPSPEGHRIFGRNFDWQTCDALVVTSRPSRGYASISTVNLGFISQAGGSLNQMLEQNDVRVLAALYAPLDGMNEKGLAVSVNMIEDRASISQDTGKPDLTTTTAVRLLLNKAASVDEALDLLQQYDLHASMGLMVHFALADTAGRAVAVEYIGNEMVVTETPVVTNFYLAEGAKQGIGSQQSHQRYDILTQALADRPTMTPEDLRDAMDSVSKDNFNEFESTEWTALFDLSTGTARYYHRENYKVPYTFSLG